SFIANVAYSLGFSATDASGGAIYNLGGQVNLQGCTFLDNRCRVGPAWGQSSGGPAYGAAIYNRGELATLICTFMSNSVTGGDATNNQWPGGWGGDARGGAVYSAGALRVERSTFSSNNARGGKGNQGVPGSTYGDFGLPGGTGGRGGHGDGGALFNSGTASLI